jgi:uncharacterized membrane protein YraQ (UPF0718 family)
LVVVVLVGAVVYLSVEPGHWVRGTGLIAGAMLLAAVLRFTLPDERAGMLVVRGRWWDSLVFLVLGVLILLADIRLRR